MFDWISHNKELFLQSHTEIGIGYQHATDLQTQHNHFAMNSMVCLHCLSFPENSPASLCVSVFSWKNNIEFIYALVMWFMGIFIFLWWLVFTHTLELIRWLRRDDVIHLGIIFQNNALFMQSLGVHTAGA